MDYIINNEETHSVEMTDYPEPVDVLNQGEKRNRQAFTKGEAKEINACLQRIKHIKQSLQSSGEEFTSMDTQDEIPIQNQLCNKGSQKKNHNNKFIEFASAKVLFLFNTFIESQNLLILHPDSYYNKRMLTVEKIGGTSMSQFSDCLNNIIIGNHTQENMYNRIFVVSAYNNVTNWLLEHKKTGESGIYTKFRYNEDYDSALDELYYKLLTINKGFESIGLSQDEANGFIQYRIKQAKTYLYSMHTVIASGYVDKDNIYLAAREILASIGEAHSAWNSVNILNNHGINATFIDLCGFNDNEPLTIDERIHNAFKGIDFNNTICIATGYTKGTEGIMRAFDRGYSEVTFSKIAVDVKADEAIIHKEFHLSSADPNLVGIDKSIPVGRTNFVIADQLADIGMEAIHPKAAKPLELAGINIRIKNTFDPSHPGTLISNDYVSPEPKIEIVSGTNRVLAFEIHDPMMVGEVGYDLRIMEVLKKHNVSYILKSTNANSITMVAWDKPYVHRMLEELRKAVYQLTVKPVAMVCAMGTNIAHPGFLCRAAKALSDKGINIECFCQSLKQINMQFVIEREHYAEAVIALNNMLCNE
ncbi:MAG: aspartate kinase [Dysgonamonadaceae bacterium]|jgi:aspartate kinase|nr:aspartate kinase [Dysgonamonadaceae bacterium]